MGRFSFGPPALAFLLLFVAGCGLNLSLELPTDGGNPDAGHPADGAVSDGGVPVDGALPPDASMTDGGLVFPDADLPDSAVPCGSHDDCNGDGECGEACVGNVCVPGRDSDLDGVLEACDCDDEDALIADYGAESCSPAGACFPEVRHCEHGQWDECEELEVFAEETCNGVDDDCDGTADEGLGGAPVCGELFCPTPDPGSMSPPALQVYEGEPETCGDGLDNDCDGLVDEECFDFCDILVHHRGGILPSLPSTVVIGGLSPLTQALDRLADPTWVGGRTICLLSGLGCAATRYTIPDHALPLQNVHFVGVSAVSGPPNACPAERTRIGAAGGTTITVDDADGTDGVSFRDVRVLSDEETAIEVATGGILSFDGTQLRSPDRMTSSWTGVVVSEGAHFLSHDSYIQDRQERRGAMLDVRGSAELSCSGDCSRREYVAQGRETVRLRPTAEFVASNVTIRSFNGSAIQSASSSASAPTIRLNAAVVDAAWNTGAGSVVHLSGCADGSHFLDAEITGFAANDTRVAAVSIEAGALGCPLRMFRGGARVRPMLGGGRPDAVAALRVSDVDIHVEHTALVGFARNGSIAGGAGVATALDCHGDCGSLHRVQLIGSMLPAREAYATSLGGGVEITSSQLLGGCGMDLAKAIVVESEADIYLANNLAVGFTLDPDCVSPGLQYAEGIYLSSSGSNVVSTHNTYFAGGWPDTVDCEAWGANITPESEGARFYNDLFVSGDHCRRSAAVELVGGPALFSHPGLAGPLAFRLDGAELLTPEAVAGVPHMVRPTISSDAAPFINASGGDFRPIHPFVETSGDAGWLPVDGAGFFRSTPDAPGAFSTAP